MKKKYKITFIIIAVILLIIGLVIFFKTINDKTHKRTPEDRIAYDDTYWNIKKLYEDENHTADLVNNDDYYTINIYDRYTNKLIESYIMDAYTGKTKENKKVSTEKIEAGAMAPGTQKESE